MLIQNIELEFKHRKYILILVLRLRCLYDGNRFDRQLHENCILDFVQWINCIFRGVIGLKN